MGEIVQRYLVTKAKAKAKAKAKTNYCIKP